MGRPRKPTIMLETVGAFDKNPDRKRTGEPIPPDAPIDKPKFLKGRAAKTWALYAPICITMGTVKHGDEAEFATWCVLQSEFEKDPIGFSTQASRLAQKRTYGERFGIAGAGSRAKLAPGTDGSKKTADPADKYFQTVTSGPGNSLRQ